MPKKPSAGEFVEQRAREHACLVDRGRLRRDALVAEAREGVADRALVVGEVEVHGLWPCFGRSMRGVVRAAAAGCPPPLMSPVAGLPAVVSSFTSLRGAPDTRGWQQRWRAGEVPVLPAGAGRRGASRSEVKEEGRAKPGPGERARTQTVLRTVCAWQAPGAPSPGMRGARYPGGLLTNGTDASTPSALRCATPAAAWASKGIMAIPPPSSRSPASPPRARSRRSSLLRRAACGCAWRAIPSRRRRWPLGGTACLWARR